MKENETNFYVGFEHPRASENQPFLGKIHQTKQ